MRKFYLTIVQIVVLIFCTLSLQAQNEIPDNKGREFWVMFTENVSPFELSLFLTGDTSTSGVVSGPFEDIPFEIIPGTITTIPIPSAVAVVTEDLIENKGIHINALEEITVYGLNRRTASTDAYLGLPVDALGTEYFIVSFNNYDRSFEPTLTSLLGIVAVENNTIVTITPADSAPNHPLGVPYSIILNEGETYQLQAQGGGLRDLTGTLVESDKPVAVFGGHVCANVPPDESFCDHLIEQLPPTSSWGTQFITVPLATRLSGDIYRVLAAQDNTVIEIFGNNEFSQSFTLNRGEFKELDIASDIYTQINATENILVAQFSKGDESDPSIANGDPFMLLVPPSDQFLSSYTVTTPETGFRLNFVNVIARTSDIGNIILDGSSIPNENFVEIVGSDFSAAQLSINLGTHNLSSSFPFGVSVYGFDDDDSYGYLGGQGLGEVAEVEEITLSIEPIIGQGSEYCFTATAVNDEGAPVPGIRVDFLINGVNSAEGFEVTDAEGNAGFCYTPENTGEDIITASVGNVNVQTTISVQEPSPSSLTLEPDSITVENGSEVCIKGIVLDQFENPLAGIEIFTEVDGEPVGSGISDENGEVEYCFTPTSNGIVNIVCYYEGGNRVTAQVTVVGELLSVFTIIDAQTDIDVVEIQDGGVYSIEDLPELLAIRVDLDAQDIGSVVFDLRGPFSFKNTESNAPYALFGNMGSDYTGRIFPPGAYALTATPYSEAQGKGIPGNPLSVNFSIVIDDIPDSLSVLGFDLYDAVSDSKIMDLEDGNIIDLGTLDHNSLSILAKTMPDFVGSLKIEMQGPIAAMRIENNRPYTLFANNSNNFFGREFPNGNYRLLATPFTEANAQGLAGTALEINFEVMGTPSSEAMKIYPVPFTDHFFVDMENNNQKLDVRLFDYLGQPVKFSRTDELGRIRVSTSSLREGLYVMQVFSEGYPLKTLKVQKMLE